jgi:hypothetical protein
VLLVNESDSDDGGIIIIVVVPVSLSAGTEGSASVHVDSDVKQVDETAEVQPLQSESPTNLQPTQLVHYSVSDEEAEIPLATDLEENFSSADLVGEKKFSCY